MLRVGRWGQASSIAQDVSEWYQTLAGRLNSLEARIPLPARRHANALIEQLFALAGNEAAKTLDAQLQPQRDEIARVQATLQEAQYHEQQLRQENHALAEAQSLAQQRLQEHQRELGSAHLALREQQARHAQETSELTARQHQLQGELQAGAAQMQELRARGELAAAAANEHLAQVRQEHAQAMLLAAQQADAERRRLMQSLDNVRVESAGRVKELQSELGRARERMETLQEKAQAQHEGATQLLDREREHFAQAQARYQALPYRQDLLLEFFAHFAQAGLHISCSQADQPRAAAWLADALGLASSAVGTFMSAVKTTPASETGENG